MNERRKQIQTARMWKYFLEAAADVMDQKGLHKMTIREVADKAGFTSSTVYNYFQDLSHLKFFAVLRLTRPYIDALPDYMSLGSSTIDKWLYGWECFCKYSFEKPEVYSLLYIDNLGKVPDELIKQYYRIYDNELIGLSEEVQSIIGHHHISTRSSLFIQDAVDEGFLNKENVQYIADTTMLIWTGMISNVLNFRRNTAKEEAAEQTMAYIEKTILNTLIPEKRSAVTYTYRSHREVFL